MKQIIGRVLVVAVCLALAQGADAAESERESERAKQGGKNRMSPNLLSGIGERPAGRVYSSLDEPGASEPKEFKANVLNLSDVDLEDVLELYQGISGRSVIRSRSLPETGITFRNEVAMSRREALQALDTVLSAQGIAMVNFGSNYVKAVPAKEAPMEAGPIIDWLPEKLPNSGTFIVYIVHTREDQLPRMIAPAIQPLAKMPNSILAVDSAHILILRDYSSNVRQMLQLIDRLGPMQEPARPARFGAEPGSPVPEGRPGGERPIPRQTRPPGAPGE